MTFNTINVKPLYIIFLLTISLVYFDLDGQSKTERSVGDFKALWVSSGFDIYLNQDENTKVYIECDDSIVNNITTTVQNGVLMIKAIKTIRWSVGKTPKIYLSVNSLKQIDVTGGSDIYSMVTLQFDSLKITAHGGSDVYLNVKCQSLRLNANGGSDINITGNTNKLVALSNGGSDINAGNLTTNICYVTATGGSEALINVTNELIADANRNSIIGYIGTPPIKQLTDDGSSDIYRK
jgi:hypothetical protein